MKLLRNPKEDAEEKRLQDCGIAKALRTAVLETFEGYGLFNRPVGVEDLPPVSKRGVKWSCITVEDPLPGQFVMLMPRQLQQEVYLRMLFGDDSDPFATTDLLDVQLELTNVLVGRAMNILIGGNDAPKMTLPQTGSDVPDVRRGTWKPYAYEVSNSWILFFIRGKSVLEFGNMSISTMIKKSGFLASVNIAKAS